MRSAGHAAPSRPALPAFDARPYGVVLPASEPEAQRPRQRRTDSVCRAIAGPAAVRILNSGTIANLAISARRRPCAWITFAASRPTREYVSFQSLNPGASYYAGVSVARHGRAQSRAAAGR